jgi:hypothetical protein
VFVALLNFYFGYAELQCKVVEIGFSILERDLLFVLIVLRVVRA